MIKCKACREKLTTLEALADHYESVHGDAIPKDFTPLQYHYMLKTGKSHGSCVICKKETAWNPTTNKYQRFCGSPVCKQKYVDQFRQRMIGAHGQIHLLNDPTQQRKMLANRSISGEYVWSDGKKIPYTGTYEKEFLKFLDVFMNYESSDIMAPSPHTYYYTYDGVEKFYIPDFFIPSLNLEIEVKDGGDNPNNHHKILSVDKEKERLKDKTMTTQTAFSYIKIVNKQYEAFFDFLLAKKKEFASSQTTDKAVFILESQTQSEHTSDVSIIHENAMHTKLKPLYHVSTSNLSGQTLTPRIPHNFLTDNGFEENKTPRVSLSTSINGCLIGMSQNLKGKEFYVHQVVDSSTLRTKKPSTSEVPDSKHTDEVWALTPVTLQAISKIKVGEAKDTPLVYQYGTHHAETYDWNWTKMQSIALESYGSSEEQRFPVFVILTHSGTMLANAIKHVTKNPYSHSSISFDSSLANMYSFGRKYKNHPLIGTFVKEDINTGFYEDVRDTTSYSLYVTFVTAQEYEQMQARLHDFQSRDNLKYDFTGLFKHKLNMISEREDAYFCSGFVGTILGAGKPMFNKHYSLIKPQDFARHKEFHFVTKGVLGNYDPAKVNARVEQLQHIHSKKEVSSV